MEVGAYVSPKRVSLSERDGMFDHVLTSPPYGDSNTTVQYGAASGICLDVVTRISGLEAFFVAGSRIDSACC
jgi:site-specific DNA-methyltransferase (cytosine-N4-specific)